MELVGARCASTHMTDTSSELETLGIALNASLSTGQLKCFLGESARRSGRRALAAVGSADDQAEAGFHSGQAVEHLCKYLLSQRDPTFLAKTQDPKTLAFLSGKGHAKAHTLAYILTVDPAKAVELAYRELGIGDPIQQDLKLVFRARNAAAHLGYGDDDSISAVGAMIRLCTPLLNTQGRTVPEWLEDQRLDVVVEVVRTLPRSDVRLSDGYRLAYIRARIWTAQREWDRLRDRIPEDHLQLLEVDPKDLSDDWEATLRPCLAGGHLAWFKSEWDRSDSQDHELGDEYQDMEQFVGGVDCPLCGLSLDGWDIHIIGLREQIGQATWGPNGPE